jgi:hypothetical protein
MPSEVSEKISKFCKEGDRWITYVIREATGPKCHPTERPWVRGVPVVG